MLQCVNVSSSSYSYPFILLKPMHLQNIALYSSVICISMQLCWKKHGAASATPTTISLHVCKQAARIQFATSWILRFNWWQLKEWSMRHEEIPQTTKKKKKHLRGFSEQLDCQTLSNCFLCIDVLIYFWRLFFVDALFSFLKGTCWKGIFKSVQPEVEGFRNWSQNGGTPPRRLPHPWQ